MPEARRRLDFSEKPLSADDNRQLGLQDLEGDVAVVLQVLGQINRGHPALTQLTLDGVAALEGCIQTRDRIGHGTLQDQTEVNVICTSR